LSVIVLSESLAAVRFIRDQIPAILSTGEIDRAELARLSEGVVVPASLQLACALGALLFFAVWLSRAVANVPALGGGDPGVSTTRAFITPFIPIYNLFKTPPIIQGVLYRLDPKAGGFFMLLLAWIGLVGSWIIDYFVGVWVNLRILTVSMNAATLGEAIEGVRAAYDLQVIVDIVTTLMVAAGAIVLVVVMFRIERRARARDREIRAAFESGVGLGSLVTDTATSPVNAPAADPAPPVPAPPVATATAEAPIAPAPAAVPIAGEPAPSLADVPAAAPPFQVAAAGPRLRVSVGADGLVASVDGSPDEPTTIDELRQAAPALAAADGTAVVEVSTDDPTARQTAGSVLDVLRRAGVVSRLV
jgi:hypothetical protein